MGNTGFSSAPNQPNILFIFIDDIGWGDLSCYGNTVTNKQGQPITPNIDRLASEGIRFTQGYVASPICSPSRTGVLTGMEPARYAIYSFLNDKNANASRNMVDWLQPDTVAAPRLFKQAGYRTGNFGKWHMGGGRDVNDAPFPQDYGFEESLVAFEGMGNRVLYKGYGLSDQNADVPGTIEWLEWYEGAPRHTLEALRFMTNAVNAGKPFYIHVPYNDTHSPYNVPPGQENDFNHITSDNTGKLFLGELHNLDKQIGRLIDAVNGLGIRTNTLILVIGDNGAPNDALKTLLNRNGGLRSGKGNIYEGGIRVPFIVSWPGQVPAGVVNTNTVISTLDLLPTYCSFAGIRLPNAPFAGEDMSDVFRGSTRQRSRPLFWEYGTVSGLSPASPKLAVRKDNFKFLRNPDGTRRELYILPNDHSEGTNLVQSPEYASVVAELESMLMTWYEEVVLGEVGETYECQTTQFTGMAISDSFNVAGGNSPGTGFGNNGLGYQFSQRVGGAAGPLLTGYRLGATGGNSPRQASDFSISNNRLTVAPRQGNGRFEFTADGTSGFNFGEYLAGKVYSLSWKMNISTVGPNYAQRMTLSVSDTTNGSVGDVDIGVQIGTDGKGGLGVFKRVDGPSNSSGTDINVSIAEGLPIDVPVSLLLRITDYNANTSLYNSHYEIQVNGVTVDSGWFRFNQSTSSRYLIFDVAAHQGTVYYDDLQLTVTGTTGGAPLCRKPVMSVSQILSDESGDKMELWWTVQPGTTVRPEVSNNLVDWVPVTDSNGDPLTISTAHGTMQWLQLPVQGGYSFFRLKKD